MSRTSRSAASRCCNRRLLDTVAASIGKSPMQVALAWLLRRSPNILLIPGTSSVKHLRENVDAKDIELTPEMVAQLDAIGGA